MTVLLSGYSREQTKRFPDSPGWPLKTAAMTARKPEDIKQSIMHVIGSPFVGNRTIALAADIIAVDARLNDWFLHIAKSTLPESELADIVELSESALFACDEAAKKFDAAWFDQPGGGLQFDLGRRTVQDVVDAEILRALP